MAQNVQDKSSCSLPSQYKKLYCAPPKCTHISVILAFYGQKVSVYCMFHVNNQKTKNVGRVTPTSQEIRPHCAQCRSMVHNISLYN